MGELDLPFTFAPIYQSTVWGGRRMETWRKDLPPGPVGESWDLSDHARGMSLVDDGSAIGTSLHTLVERHGRDLVGERFTGGVFPLMVKLIDAADRLSVQVHPDDRLAVELGVGDRGKTECWLMLDGGGQVFVGTIPGCDRERFAAAIADGTVEALLQHYPVKDDDFFFIPARTVHALGGGCLLYEIQQTCDTTFRVHDWNRMGLDGKPRQLHLEHGLTSISFDARVRPPTTGRWTVHTGGGSVRPLVNCDYFDVEERRCRQTSGGDTGSCTVIVCLSGQGVLATDAGEVALSAMRTALVPAAAGAWSAKARSKSWLRLLVAHPA